ncbi:hypothetical protein [Burkholderia singularis]|uniref:hypothetical protein n=1 Tax=Burkholderia singularis TaxID=1503053 RepID=UPI00117FE485|nr:hypothetical protein [Burkholderia singularis]
MAATDTNLPVALTSTRDGWAITFTFQTIHTAMDFLDENGIYEFELDVPHSGNVMLVTRKFDRDAPIVPADSGCAGDSTVIVV